MNQADSEDLFLEYLVRRNFLFERNYPVGRGNLDFRVERSGSVVLCDVKEVRDPEVDSHGKIEAHEHIRSDIRKLRAKFKHRPEIPVVLVTINVSTRFFTGATVAVALLGDIGVDFNRSNLSITTPLHHLNKGNAVLTKTHNRSISGVFVFDIVNRNHCLFTNPFTDHPVPQLFFPEVRVVDLNRDAQGDEIKELSNTMFWNAHCNNEA